MLTRVKLTALGIRIFPSSHRCKSTLFFIAYAIVFSYSGDRTIFFIWAFRRGGSTNLHPRPEHPHSITYNLYKAAAPSGCPLQCPAGTGHSIWMIPPFKGARGDYESHKPPSISASIPNARSSVRHPRFAAKHPIPSFDTFPLAAIPPRTTLLPMVRCRPSTNYRYATANAVDKQKRNSFRYQQKP